MEWIQTNANFIILGILVLVIALIIAVLSNQISLGRTLTGRKLTIRTALVVNPTTKDKEIQIYFYNRNINDTRITGFGFKYLVQNIDYYHYYLTQKQLPIDARVSLTNNEHLVLTLKPDELKVILFNLNQGTYRVRKLHAYISESQGVTTVRNARNIRSFVQKLLTADLKVEQLRLATIRRQQRHDRQIIRRTKRQLFYQHVRAEWHKLLNKPKP